MIISILAKVYPLAKYWQILLYDRMVKRYLCLPRNSSVTAQIKGLWHADLEAVIFGVGEIEIAIIALILEETEHPPRGRQGIRYEKCRDSVVRRFRKGGSHAGTNRQIAILHQYKLHQ